MNFGFTLHLEGAANSRQYFRYANMALRVYYIYKSTLDMPHIRVHANRIYWRPRLWGSD